MALVRGGGGNISPANVAGLGHSAEIAAWEAEQERKKLAAQNITMSVVRAAPGKLTEQAPSSTFRDRSVVARQLIAPNTLEGYWKQVQTSGGQRQVGERARTIKSLWDTYLSPYDGSKAIAGLLVSPYATDEIEVMMKAANRAMFSGGGVTPLKIPPELVRKLGLDPSNPAHTAAAGLRVANGGFLSAPATTRNAVTASKQNGLLNRVWNFMAEGTKELVANTYHDLIEPITSWGAPEVKDVGEYTEDEWKELQQSGAGKLFVEEAFRHRDSESRLSREEIEEVLAQPWDSAAAQNFMQYRKASEAAMAEATGLAAGVGLLALPGGAAAVEGIVGRIFANPYTRAMAQHGTKFGVEAFRADVTHDVLTGANQQWGGGNEVVQGVVDAASGFLMARGGYNMLKGVSGTVGAAAAGGGKVAGLTYAGVKGTAGLAGLNALAAGADAFVQAADAPGQIEYNAKAQEAFENPMAAGGAEAQLASLMALIDTADVQTAQEIWEWTQTDQTIGEGDEQQVLIPGYGQNIPWSGGFTWEMKQAVADKFAAEKRFNIENQIMLQKSGFADLDLELDGVLGENATDDWKLAMDRALAAEDKNLSFSTDHPEWGKVLGMMGMPLSKEGWMAKERLLLNHGPLQAIASNLVLMPVNALGGLYNGTLAACTYGTSMLTDGVYNRLKKEYQEAVASEAPDVEEKKQAALQRKAWLLQNTFIPDAIMPVSELFGKDVDEAVEWHKNHPEVSLLADITRDALVAFATPAAMRFVKEQFFPAREYNSAVGNPLMKHRMSVVLKEVMREGGRGLEFAKEAVGRTADGEALVRTIEQLYQGKTARKAWEPLAKEMVDAADSGNIERIMELTTLDQAGAQALANKLRTVTGPTGAVDPVAARIKKAGNVLAAEQRGSHGLLNMAAIALETGSRAWADGKSIFPDWASPLVPKRSSAHRLIVNSIDNIKHDGAREFATTLLAPWEVKGTRTIDVGNNLANSHRVFYSALTATGDIRASLELASRWIRNPDPKARFAVGDRTATALEHRYDVTPSVKMDEHNVEVGVNPITGEKLGEGLPALPTYLRYTADFGAQSRALNAQYSKAIIEEWGGVRGFVAKYMANPVRFVEGYPKFGLQDASAYLRHLTVATGPLLATKHLFADTSRTLLASPYAIIDSRGQAEGFAQRVRDVAAMDNQVAKNVLYQKSMMESSLAHYYGHKADVPMGDFHSFQIYEPDAGGNVVAVKGRVESGAEAIRRIANDPVTRAWAEGGWDGVREWLKGADGRQFLNRSSIAIRYLEANKGAKQSDLIDYYIDTYAEPLLEGLNQTAPLITNGVRDMALGNRLASSAEAKKLLQEVNGDGVIENPYLSIADKETTPWWQHSISAFMTPNRVNRALLFNRVFNKTYDSMLKEGVEKPQAATVAMDLARLTTERIHFDLANALNIEARRRYAAWFATKHRLYDTWILREMLQRPSIAGAAQTLLNFLETKNEGDDTIKEWDKEKWAIDIDKYMPGLNKLLGPVLGSPEGNKMLIDPRTLYWLYESNWESSVGQIEESALAWIIETATGANMPPMQSTFGVMSTGRTDRVVGSLAISLPIFLAASKGELNDEWLKKYLDGDVDDLGMVSQMGLFAGNTWLGRPAMEQLRKSIDYQLATAHHKGVELQPYEAAVMAAYQGIGYEFMQVGKIWPGRIQLGTATKMDTLMQQWTELDPDARIQFMDEHPEIRYMFGIYSTNPVDQHSIVKGFTDVAKIQRERGNAFANAVDNGSIWNYETVMGINALYDDMIEQVTNRDWLDPDTGAGSSLRNDTFSDFLNTLGQGDLSFSEILQAMFPIMDVKVVNQQSYIPNEYQQRMKKTELNEAFESVLERALQPDAEGNFYDVTNPNDPYRAWLEYDNITQPMNAFMKYQDPAGWATGYQKQVFDELAQTTNGITLSAKYLTYAHRQYLMAELVKGASGYAKTGVAGLPMFATMTTEAKERIGRTSTKAAENTWREYSARYSQAKAVLRQNGVSESSEAGKALMGSVTKWAEQQASQPGNEVFSDEWAWCKKPIEERLVDIGITESGQPNSPFWGEFLNLVSAYKQGLSILDVGPTAQKAYPVHELFWPELDKLRDKYPAGWNQLVEVFGGLSKFGFSKWRPPEGMFSQLFLGTVDESAYEGGND